ncbi:MAG TPA: malectin domain-containing carbohydrate-binding protein, partial [Armatimonadota bacterium]|nr:malectin domain-containing carbohydrate-binding protein [Armatimonadota bacterium]
PRLQPGGAYLVRLHFAEIEKDAAGQRKFDVAINGKRVLTDLDLFATAQAKNRAVVKEFPAWANADGKIIVQLLKGSTGDPSLAGIEIDARGTGVAPSVVLQVSGEQAYLAPATINTRAQVSVGSISKVELYAGDRKVAESTTWPFDITWAQAPAGHYTLVGKAVDAGGAVTTSNTLPVAVKPVLDAVTTRFEAEDGTTSGGVGQKPQASNGAYVGFLDGQGKWVKIEVNAVKAGTYSMVVCYANGMGTPATRTLYINDVRVAQLTFPATPNWAAYLPLAAIKVDLHAGKNEIRLQNDPGDTKTIDCDYIELSQ